jgi:hypothetical protein
MKKFNWKSTISTNVLFLKVTGLWPETGLYKLNKYTLYMIFVVILVNSHNFFLTANVVNAYQDLQALSAIIFTIFMKWLTSGKMIFFIRKSETLKHLITQLENEEFQPKNEPQVVMVQPLLKMWKMIYFVYWVPVFSTITFWTIFPILDGTVKDYRLPFSAWYPHDYKMSPLYEITYLYQVVCFWYLATLNVNMDTLIASLMMYIGTQCDISTDNLKNLRNDGDKDFAKKLLQFVEHHKKVVRYDEESDWFDLCNESFRFATECNNFFNEIVLGQFFTSAVSLAVAMFQVTVVS